jgi:PAS domain S-box-containing protein
MAAAEPGTGSRGDSMAATAQPSSGGVDALRAAIWRLGAQTDLSDRELIQRLLDTVGPVVGVDRACFNSHEGEGVRTTLEWCAPGIKPTVGTDIPDFLTQPFLAGQDLELTLAETLAFLPEPMRTMGAPIVEAIVASQDIKSYLVMPYRVDGEVEGALSFDQCHDVPAGWSLPLRPLIAEMVQIVARTISRQRAAAALQESERRYRDLAELLPIMLFETDATGRITYANRHGLESLGYTEVDLRAGVSIEDLVAPDHGDAARERLAAVMRESGGTGREHRVRRRDGGSLWVEAYAGAMKVEGRVAGIRCVAIDITERKRAETERRNLEARMLHAQKLESLGLLAGGVAHDFNNVLVGILGNAELELDDASRKGVSRKRLEKIRDGARRATELAGLMLAYAGGGHLTPEPVDLSRIAREVLDVMRSVVSPEATVLLELTSGLPKVEADPTQLRQVVMNLVLNASEALGGRPGRIMVRTKAVREGEVPRGAVDIEGGPARGPLVVLEVEDSGCGMDDATVGRMFDPFFTTKFLGRGLGLAAAIGIVRQHRGTIQVRSAPGEGTMMRVLLPLAGAEAAEAAGR